MLSRYISKIIPFTILPIAIISVNQFAHLPIGNTTIWWLVESFILMVYFLAVYDDQRESGNRDVMLFVKLYLLWNIFSIFRGMLIAETYWDWKSLVVNTFGLLMPIIAYISSNKERVKSILSFYIKYALPLSIIILVTLIRPISTWTHFFYPITFLIFFFPVLSIRWKSLLIFLTLFSILSDLQTRSSLFKFGVPVLLLGIYYFRHIIASVKILEVIRKILTLVPWLLFFLAVSGIFNVFKIDEYIKTDYVATTTDATGEVIEQEITQDSRTPIYEEVLNSAQNNNYWFIGRSPARGNDIVNLIQYLNEDIDDRMERRSNEASVLNVFTWTGILGVLLYFLVFYRASWLAVNQSNNIYSKLIGLFVAFRWAYAWVEDENVFNLNYFTIWLIIGICYSKSIRKMNNTEIKLWANEIFERKKFIRPKTVVFQNNPSKI